MSRFWSQIVHNLTPYIPGEQPKVTNLIKLNTNENPYGPSPKVLAAIHQANSEILRLYPDPRAQILKDAIARYYANYQITPKQIFVGNGSDEVLALAFQGLLKHDQPLLLPDITYSFYPVYCALYQINYRTLPIDTHFQINIDEYQQPAGAIIFPNPNAPTGHLLSLDKIERLLQIQPNALILIDEAYIDFTQGPIPTAIALVNRYPNLLIVQTLSKSRALAGLRVGLAIGHADLIQALERIKDSFNSYPLDHLAITGAAAAFNDVAYFEEIRHKIIATREKLTLQLQNLGFQVLSSATNFVFVHHPQYDATQLAQRLREKNIFVRHFKQPRIEQYLRISIGTNEECAILLQELIQIMGSN